MLGSVSGHAPDSTDSTRSTLVPLKTVYYKPTVQKYPYDSEADCIRSIPSDAYNIEKPYCNATYDAVLCWPPTRAGVIIMQSCPPLRGLDLTKYAFRTCSHTGYWEFKTPNSGGPNIRGWTNYSVCIKAEITDLYHKFNSNPHAELFRTTLHGTRIMEMIGLSLSLICLLVALVVFFSFRSLRNDRTKIHRNLFIAILIQVLIRLTLYSDQYVTSNLNFAGLPISPGKSKGISNTAYVCESFYVFLEYAKTVTFMWMLVEGFYLHNIIVASVFESRPNMCIFNLIGWGIPVILTGMWAVTYALKTERTTCWYLYSFTGYYWILEGARLAVICVNFVFLLNIIRVVVSKLRDTNSTDAQQAKKAAKAAMILLPLLGITNSVSLVPVLYKPVPFVLWTWGAYFLVSFQGFFVALIYCFLNQEVKDTLHNAWKRRLFNKGKHPNRESDGSIISRLSFFARDLPTGHFSEKIRLRRLNSALPGACALTAHGTSLSRAVPRRSVASYFTTRFSLRPSLPQPYLRATVVNLKMGTDHLAPCTKVTQIPVVGATHSQRPSSSTNGGCGNDLAAGPIRSSSNTPSLTSYVMPRDRNHCLLSTGFRKYLNILRRGRPSFATQYDPLIKVSEAHTLDEQSPSRVNGQGPNTLRRQTEIIVTVDSNTHSDDLHEGVDACLAIREPRLMKDALETEPQGLIVPKINQENKANSNELKMYGAGMVYPCPNREGCFFGKDNAGADMVFEDNDIAVKRGITNSLSNETAITLLTPSPDTSPTG